ncbi:hypothetical protein FACS1894126_5700 [Alphaproteobacteria bacterium]|nr:hypothetical protein FACS1894126_5700 [Alphaproteobacteria bacterium]
MNANSGVSLVDSSDVETSGALDSLDFPGEDDSEPDSSNSAVAAPPDKKPARAEEQPEEYRSPGSSSATASHDAQDNINDAEPSGLSTGNNAEEPSEPTPAPTRSPAAATPRVIRHVAGIIGADRSVLTEYENLMRLERNVDNARALIGIYEDAHNLKMVGILKRAGYVKGNGRRELITSDKLEAFAQISSEELLGGFNAIQAKADQEEYVREEVSEAVKEQPISSRPLNKPFAGSMASSVPTYGDLDDTYDNGRVREHGVLLYGEIDHNGDRQGPCVMVWKRQCVS